MNAFTAEKMNLISNIIFNVFSGINYVTLENAIPNTNCTNYFLNMRKEIGEMVELDDKHRYFTYGNDIKDCEKVRFFLRNSFFQAKTNGVYVVERKNKTEPIIIDSIEMFAVKFFPFAAFFGFKGVELYHKSGLIVTRYEAGDSPYIYLEGTNLSFNIREEREPIRLTTKEMNIIAKMAINENK